MEEAHTDPTHEDTEVPVWVGELRRLVSEGRLLAAEEAVARLRTREALLDSETRELLRETAVRIAEVREIIGLSAQHSADSGWVEAMTLFGITTSYMVLADGLLRVKLEGALEELPVLEQIAVLREADLFHEWIPFCSSSTVLHGISHNELIAHFNVYSPLLSRDAVIHAYGVDCLQEEDGLVLLVVRSVSEFRGLPLPPPLRSILGLNDRVDFKALNAIIRLTRLNVAETTIMCTVDLKMPLPQFATNFIIKHMAGVTLYCHQRKVRQIIDHPDCEYARRIREDTVFYESWLRPKIENFYQLKGWSSTTETSSTELPAS